VGCFTFAASPSQITTLSGYCGGFVTPGLIEAKLGIPFPTMTGTYGASTSAFLEGTAGGDQEDGETLLTVSSQAGPGTYINFQGGPSSAPVVLPGGSVNEVTGTIGGLGAADYYDFFRAGGAFNASGMITGSPNAGASYSYSLGVFNTSNGSNNCDSAGGTPLPDGTSGFITLNGSNGFAGTISDADLAPGQYCIGFGAVDPNDPGFDLVFNTAVTGASSPEPSSFVLFLSGLLVVVRFGGTQWSRHLTKVNSC